MSSFPATAQAPGNFAYTSRNAPLLKKNEPAVTGYNVYRLPRSFRIVLHSQNRMAGTPLTAATFNVPPLPAEFASSRLHVTVESFIVGSLPNTQQNLDRYPYTLGIRELTNGCSYDSRSGGPGGIVSLLTTRTYAPAVQKDVGGAIITDPSFFERPITIVFDSPHFDVAAADGIRNEWSLSLVLHDAGTNEPTTRLVRR